MPKMPTIFAPYQSEMDLIYCWYTTIPHRFAFCINSNDRPIRQFKRLTMQAHFAKVTEAKPEVLFDCRFDEVQDNIYQLTHELLLLGYPMFDQQGEPITEIDIDETQLPQLTPIASNYDFGTPPTQEQLAKIMSLVNEQIKSAARNRSYVDKYRVKGPRT